MESGERGGSGGPPPRSRRGAREAGSRLPGPLQSRNLGGAASEPASTPRRATSPAAGRSPGRRRSAPGSPRACAGAEIPSASRGKAFAAIFRSIKPSGGAEINRKMREGAHSPGFAPGRPGPLKPWIKRRRYGKDGRRAMTTKTTPGGAMNERSATRGDGRARVTWREAFHVLLAAATWVLFFYWWGIVLPQVRRDDAVMAALFIVLTSAATALLTAAWVRYNIGIYRRKGPRLQLTPAAPNRDTDALGRAIVRPDDGSLRTSRVVVVAVDGDRKTMEPGGES